MRTIHETSQFRRDLKKLKKQGKDLEKLVLRHFQWEERKNIG
jgi:mRNA-degrading endonuclease YafQ of YafQ-DinJ toxin-antitoxin module